MEHNGHNKWPNCRYKVYKKEKLKKKQSEGETCCLRLTFINVWMNSTKWMNGQTNKQSEMENRGE